MHIKRGLLAGLVPLALAALLATACGSSHSSSAGPAVSSAAGAARSALAQPTTSADIAAAKALLLANFQKDFNAKHPVKSSEAALRATFPTGSTRRIVSFGVSKLTPAVLSLKKPNPARDAWAQEVVTFALANGGSTLPPGSANIPGFPPPSASAS